MRWHVHGTDATTGQDIVLAARRAGSDPGRPVSHRQAHPRQSCHARRGRRAAADVFAAGLHRLGRANSLLHRGICAESLRPRPALPGRDRATPTGAVDRPGRGAGEPTAQHQFRGRGFPRHDQQNARAGGSACHGALAHVAHGAAALDGASADRDAGKCRRRSSRIAEPARRRECRTENIGNANAAARRGIFAPTKEAAGSNQPAGCLLHQNQRLGTGQSGAGQSTRSAEIPAFGSGGKIDHRAAGNQPG